MAQDDAWSDIGPCRPNRVSLYRQARKVEELAREAAGHAQHNNIRRAMEKLAQAEAAAKTDR